MNLTALKLTPVRVAIVLLTLVTAVIHIALGRPLFILNGLGYIALLAAYLLPQPLFARRRALIRWAFIAYTVVTIVMYFVVHAGGSWQQDGLGIPIARLLG